MIVRIGYALGGLLFGCAIVAGVELLLRVMGVAEGAPRYDPFAGFSSKVPVFEKATRADGQVVYRLAAARTNPSAPKDFVEPQREFLAAPPENVFRIFVIGESSAAGVPYSTRYAFSSWLERRLRAALPDQPLEVVNVALSGYASRRLLPIVQALAQHKPNLLIIYMGHNEWAEAMYYKHLLNMDPRLFRLLETVYATRIYALASRVLDISGVRPRPPVLNVDPRDNINQMFGVLRERAAGHGYPIARELAYRDLLYEHNLEDMIRTIEAAGARVMLLTLSQNFSDWPPPASTHRDGLDETALRTWEEHFSEGRRLAKTQDGCAGALLAYSQALEIDPTYAELHFEIANCQRRLGDFEEARVHYRLASDLDRVPHGAPTYFNDIIRRLAGKHDTLFVDVDQLLTEESGPGLVGNDLFTDFAHPKIRAHQRIAEAISESLRKAGLPVEARSWKSSAYVDPDPETLYQQEPRLRILELQSRVLVCTLAPREGCLEEARALLDMVPGDVIARTVFMTLSGEKSGTATPHGSSKAQ